LAIASYHDFVSLLPGPDAGNAAELLNAVLLTLVVFRKPVVLLEADVPVGTWVGYITE
jgi:hypothetical protein